MKRYKIPKKKISVAPKKPTDAGVEIQSSRRQAALIWDSFQDTMKRLALEEKLDAGDLPRHLNDLGARIQKEVKNKVVREATEIMIDRKIVELSKYLIDFKAVLNNTVNVIAHCPHENSINNVKSFCDWTARVRVDKKEFENGIANIQCGSCQKQITTGDMTLP